VKNANNLCSKAYSILGRFSEPILLVGLEISACARLKFLRRKATMIRIVTAERPEKVFSCAAPGALPINAFYVLPYYPLEPVQSSPGSNKPPPEPRHRRQ